MMGTKGGRDRDDEGNDVADMVEAGMRAQKKARLLEQVNSKARYQYTMSTKTINTSSPIHNSNQHILSTHYNNILPLHPLLHNTIATRFRCKTIIINHNSSVLFLILFVLISACRNDSKTTRGGRRRTVVTSRWWPHHH